MLVLVEVLYEENFSDCLYKRIDGEWSLIAERLRPDPFERTRLPIYPTNPMVDTLEGESHREGWSVVSRDQAQLQAILWGLEC